MADVLNRTTRELLTSKHEPDYDPADWIINPDLSAVANVPQSRWVIEGDTIRPPDETELAAFLAAELATAKAAKMTAIDSRTQSLLSLGVRVNGASVSTSIAAQTTLLGMRLSLADGWITLPQDISTTDGGTHTITDQTEFNRVCQLVLGRVKSVLDQGRALREQVIAAADVTELASIVDNRT